MFADKDSIKQVYLMKLIEGEGITTDEETQRDKFIALVRVNHRSSVCCKS